MKDYLKQLLSGAANPTQARCLAVEYLQARILQSLQDSGVFRAWAFQGGTALRFLYGLPRFSEDLDFALVTAGQRDDFRTFLNEAGANFKAENYDVRIKVNDRKTVKSAFVSFVGLPFEVGLSPHRTEVLSVKVELDANPPAGAGVTTSIVRRYVTLNLQHHDQPSLLAGKLHAVLARPYVKGRDVYDLIWYLSDRTWPAPNLQLLNHALKQTDWKGTAITEANWRIVVAESLTSANWENVVNDVRPFLERERDVNLLTKENALKLLQG